MRLRRWTRATLALSLLLAGCGENAVDPLAGDEEMDSGGAATVYEASSHAYEFPAPNLSGIALDRHLDGDAVFERTFVTSPAIRFGGLGPLFNDTACSACHARNGATRDSRLVRVSLDGVASDGGPVPVPGFGLQIQDRATFGKPPEARPVLLEVITNGAFVDGAPYALRRFDLRLEDPYRPLPGGIRTSIRFAPPVFGLGLLEAVAEATLESLADPDDSNGDGISGRPNRVPGPGGGVRLGRFGWKAGAATLVQQTAGAYQADMGVTNPIHADDESAGRQEYGDDLDDDPEIDVDTVDLAAFYVRTLAVPARRKTGDPEVRRGFVLFSDIGCAGCHVTRLETGPLPDVPEFSGLTIRPYTDLLLHDMGEGLADGRSEYVATGNEWRTPPLWGIGLRFLVNGHEQFLHDGRARGLEEAVLWHGGEAEAARNGYRRLRREDRAALIAFLKSL